MNIPSEKDSHFKFGENWDDYSRTITQNKIDEAVRGLSVLLDTVSLEEKIFLDIGCGSGIHALAALKMGAEKIVAVDLDPDSVNTTRRVLKELAPNKNWECLEKSVFELDPATMGKFDVVYSWDVLHHTGNLWRAIDKASDLVEDSGALAISIYIKTPFCWAWRWEKWAYSKFPRLFQSMILFPFAFFWLLGKLVRGINPLRFLREYQRNRGMNFFHDCHDWLGGYPYESATPEQVETALSKNGLKLFQKFKAHPPLGLFGTWCAEYMFRKGG